MDNAIDTATLDMVSPTPVLAGSQSESYWQERNALVDAALSLSPDKSWFWKAQATWTPEQKDASDRYGEALKALEAFDAAHGGTPIL